MLELIEKDIRQLADPTTAKTLQGFFKTGPGEYGVGDIFVGIKVPVIRSLVKKYTLLPLADLKRLLREPIHEKRLLALFIMIEQYTNAKPPLQKKLYTLYLANTDKINNWDLVDLSAPSIVGPLAPLNTLRKLARSKLIWDRRIAMLATFWHIKNKNAQPTFEIAELLLKDKQDLMHKAVGWMLREAGKRIDQELEEQFLQKNKRYKTMPRTMLRYTIERFPEKKRQAYLKGTI